ncbi:DUF397 domain-containing protein [Lipingzhangella sp. LS1_29]|uniref:DUF397 domain-containing protein n=1 Tax=Lipingzhangella rawalii TaxID=2055835 RepID=A0ABU2HCX0_9ACTN|nr:DUF397 domain-containing protein [Lipingzhangella rawalii]MDS1272685.1 DUF397 domain-containing protein [Lipingzhangella rawalii]
MHSSVHNWRTSSYSAHGDNTCVEVGDLHGAVAMRDSQHPELGHLTVPVPEWTAFMVAIRSGGL